mmetsp:Transcript_124299/g.284811  ORF Transcript_124299/g.284811 Transcript_124299/m.284811 type:complete len:279 (-) Transcript_124299:215-1051(-)
MILPLEVCCVHSLTHILPPRLGEGHTVRRIKSVLGPLEGLHIHLQLVPLVLRQSPLDTVGHPSRHHVVHACFLNEYSHILEQCVDVHGFAHRHVICRSARDLLIDLVQDLLRPQRLSARLGVGRIVRHELIKFFAELLSLLFWDILLGDGLEIHGRSLLCLHLLRIHVTLMVGEHIGLVQDRPKTPRKPDPVYIPWLDHVVQRCAPQSLRQKGKRGQREKLIVVDIPIEPIPDSGNSLDRQQPSGQPSKLNDTQEQRREGEQECSRELHKSLHVGGVV